MPNLSAVIGADTSKFVQEIQSAQYMLDKYVNETKNAKESVEKNVSVTNEQVAAYRKVVSALSQVASGTMNTKKQQAELTNQIRELKVQWANLSDTAKSGDFGKMLGSTLETSQGKLTQLTDQIKQANTELGNFGGENAKRQLMGLSKELTNLTLQYRQMSDAERSSAGGQELAAKLSDLRKRAGELKDTVGDVQQEIKVLASDTPNLDVFNDAIGLGADALSAYSSILARVTGDEKALKDAISTVMAVQSAANFVTKLTNALQSSSAIMLKTRQIQEGATALAINIRTAAEGKGVVVTKAATLAQKAFNTVAKMNPYVLLATAIIAAGAAIYGFTQYLNKANDEQEKAKQKAEALKQKQEELKKEQEELSSSAAKVKTKYTELQAQWQSLKTLAEKTKWIEDNKSAFSDLGLSITNVKTAEDIFVNNTRNVIKALAQRAVAIAKVEQLKKKLEKLYDLKDEKSYRSGYKKLKITNTTRISDDLADESDVRRDNQVFVGVDPNSKRTDEEVKKVNDVLAKQARERAHNFHSDIDKSINELVDDIINGEKEITSFNNALQDLGDKPVKTTSHKSKPDKKDKDKYTDDSLTKLEKKLDELKSKYKDGLLPKLTPDEYKKQVEDLEKQIRDKKIKLGIEVPVEELEGSLAKLEKEISDKQNELKLVVSDESRAKIQAEIDKLTGQKEAIELKLKPVVQDKDIKKLQDEINEHQTEVKTNVPKPWEKTTPEQKAQDNADKLKTELDFNKQILKSIQDQYDAVQKRISLGATLTSNEQQLVNIYDQTKNKVDELADSYEKAAASADKLKLNSELTKKTFEGFKSGVETLGSVNNAIGGTISQWQSLNENWSDMSPFEQITSAFGTVISTIQNVIQAYESINSMIELFSTISELASAKKVAQATAESAAVTAEAGAEAGANATVAASEVAANTTKMASDVAATTTNQILTAVENTAAYASIPFAGPALAAAAMAQYKALWATAILPFADGGIFYAPSSIGDYNIARVNNGEMILNGTQQKRLFNLLNGVGGYVNGPIQKQNVNFVIKGKTLRGVLRNFDNAHNKI